MNLIGDRKDYKFDVQVECARQPKGDRLSLIGAWSGHVTH